MFFFVGAVTHNSYVRCRTIALLALLCAALTSLAAPPPPGPPLAPIYRTGFEASEGYNLNLDLVGQNGWTNYGAGGNGLVNGVFPGKGQQAYIGWVNPGGSNLWVLQPLNRQFSRAQFSVTVAVFDSSNTANYDDFQWSVFNEQGDQLFTISLYNPDRKIYYRLDGTNDYKDSGLAFTNGIPYPLNISMSFVSNRWSAGFNGALLATNQPITTVGAPLNLGDIDATWILTDNNAPGDNYMVFDDYTISGVVPPPGLRVIGFLSRAPVIRVSGTPDENFALDCSTNLVNWAALKTNITTGGSFDYTDSSAVGLSRRFYRGRWVP